MKLGPYIRQRRSELRLNQIDLAQKSGIGQSHISQIESGILIPSKISILESLAKALKVDSKYLFKLAEEDRREKEKRSIIEKAKSLDISMPGFPPHRIPILNEIPADIPNNFTDYDFPPGVAEDYVDNYLKGYTTADPSLYALRVGGDCMEPELKRGDIVILSSTKQWESGDIVAVKWDNGEKKELRKIIRQNDHIILKAENPKYDPIVLNKDDGPQIMGVCIMVIRVKK